MGRKTEQTFFQRGNADGQQVYEKMLNTANHEGKKKNLSEWLSSKRTQITNIGDDVEKSKHLYTVGRNANWCSHCGKQCGNFSNSTMQDPERKNRKAIEMITFLSRSRQANPLEKFKGADRQK